MRSMKVPFQSGNVRFEENKVEDTPGPGAYQVKFKVYNRRCDLADNDIAWQRCKIEAKGEYTSKQLCDA